MIVNQVGLAYHFDQDDFGINPAKLEKIIHLNIGQYFSDVYDPFG